MYVFAIHLSMFFLQKHVSQKLNKFTDIFPLLGKIMDMLAYVFAVILTMCDRLHIVITWSFSLRVIFHNQSIKIMNQYSFTSNFNSF